MFFFFFFFCFLSFRIACALETQRKIYVGFWFLDLWMSSWFLYLRDIITTWCLIALFVLFPTSAVFRIFRENDLRLCLFSFFSEDKLRRAEAGWRSSPMIFWTARWMSGILFSWTNLALWGHVIRDTFLASVGNTRVCVGVVCESVAVGGAARVVVGWARAGNTMRWGRWFFRLSMLDFEMMVGFFRFNWSAARVSSEKRVRVRAMAQRFNAMLSFAIPLCALN